ncbi:MAG: glycosyltransferase family 39 protein [Bryobacterales bacterium]|nr:glycosyltransferase family 39 protein [Bryobacterales bacterium]
MSGGKKPAGTASTSSSDIGALLDSKLTWLVIAVIVVLLGVQLRHASLIHLNPDEALHYQLAHQTTLYQAYLENNTNAHPPLLILLLHFWLKLSTAEWFLRLIPISAYCGMIWFAWRWGALALNREAGFTLAMLLAFTPSIFNLATEIRHYMPVFCFALASLYYFERAVEEASSKWMAVSAAMLALTILSDYSAVWFTAGFGVYTLLRVWRAGLPGKTQLAWVGGQAGATLLYLVLYVTHISKLRDAGISREAREGWLGAMYCAQGCDAASFLSRHTAGLYSYAFGSPWEGLIGAMLAMAGIGFLFERYPKGRPLIAGSAAAFLSCMAAAGGGLYPYGGTRHSLPLFLWIAACVAAAAGVAGKGRLPLLLGGIAVIIPVWRLAALPETQVLPVAEQRREFAVDAVGYLREKVSPGGIVFVDLQSILLLLFYHSPDVYPNPTRGHFWDYNLDGLHVVMAPEWSLDPTPFVDELKVLKQTYHLEKGAEVWVFDGGWGSPISRMLNVQYSGTVLPELAEFGEHFAVFRVPN